MTRIHNDFASAEISPLGAELVRLQDAQGRDWLWDANPAWWKGHSPLLFPIVGNVRDDRIVVDGREYPMKRHGLARISTFEPAESAPSRCAYVLKSSDATRAQYPFDFELRVTYALEGSTLAITAVITNAGEAPMPASFGFHPAMKWPFPGDDAKTDTSSRSTRSRTRRSAGFATACSSTRASRPPSKARGCVSTICCSRRTRSFSMS